MLDHSCQVQRHPLGERKDDLYETPPSRSRRCCGTSGCPIGCGIRRGPGNIVKVLRAAGHEVIGSDLVDYGDPTHFYRRDFLMERKAPGRLRSASSRTRRSSSPRSSSRTRSNSVRCVMVLLRLAFMESERRTAILEGRGLARIHQFRKRLPMMHRPGWEGRKANSGMAFAWFMLGPREPSGTDDDRSDLLDRRGRAVTGLARFPPRRSCSARAHALPWSRPARWISPMPITISSNPSATVDAGRWPREESAPIRPAVIGVAR